MLRVHTHVAKERPDQPLTFSIPYEAMSCKELYRRIAKILNIDDIRLLYIREADWAEEVDEEGKSLLEEMRVYVDQNRTMPLDLHVRSDGTSVLLLKTPEKLGWTQRCADAFDGFIPINSSAIDTYNVFPGSELQVTYGVGEEPDTAGLEDSGFRSRRRPTVGVPGSDHGWQLQDTASECTLGEIKARCADAFGIPVAEQVLCFAHVPLVIEGFDHLRVDAPELVKERKRFARYNNAGFQILTREQTAKMTRWAPGSSKPFVGEIVPLLVRSAAFGNNLPASLHEFDTEEDVKERCAEITGEPPEKMQLFAPNGMELEWGVPLCHYVGTTPVLNEVGAKTFLSEGILYLRQKERPSLHGRLGRYPINPYDMNQPVVIRTPQKRELLRRVVTPDTTLGEVLASVKPFLTSDDVPARPVWRVGPPDATARAIDESSDQAVLDMVRRILDRSEADMDDIRELVKTTARKKWEAQMRDDA